LWVLLRGSAYKDPPKRATKESPRGATVVDTVTSETDKSWVIRGARVLTMAGPEDALDVDVWVANGQIQALLPQGAPVPAPVREWNGAGCALLPGFVQTHVHLCQTLFRNLADDLALLDWLQQRVWPLEGAHDPDSLYASARLGIWELLRGGTTTILDMGTVKHHDAVFHALESLGMRALSGKTMMDDPNTPMSLRESTDASITESVDLCQRWHGANQGLLQYAFAPRFALSCTHTLLSQLGDLAQQYGVRIHTHASENRDEISLVTARTGLRNIQYFDSIGLLSERLCIAHCIWLDRDEVELLARSGAHALHCPSSNLKLGSGICDVPGLLAAGVSVSIGADGAPCNNNLSAFNEIRLAALLQKPIHGPTAMRAYDVLRLATIEGARALGLGHLVGTIEPGKRADLQLIRLSGAHMGPGESSLAGRLVYGGRDSDVEAVWVDGALRVSGGELVGLSEREVVLAAARQVDRVLGRAGL
jgi:cytosine/adenosine deaminase-related metal-dependent hydrolase